MCGACGILGGGPEWLDRSGGPDGLAPAQRETRRAERQRRIRLVNAMLRPSGVILAEFGNKLVVRGATGRVAIVDDLAHVWRAADDIGRRPVDPLAPAERSS
jgi:hypothetical protein